MQIYRISIWWELWLWFTPFFIRKTCKLLLHFVEILEITVTETQLLSHCFSLNQWTRKIIRIVRFFAGCLHCSCCLSGRINQFGKQGKFFLKSGFYRFNLSTDTVHWWDPLSEHIGADCITWNRFFFFYWNYCVSSLCHSRKWLTWVVPNYCKG